MKSGQIITIKEDYKVVVGCLTYNHSKYIVDALNGFAMQRTNFPFACIVMDDASTDGEQDVIRNWLQNECDMEQAENYDLELADVIIAPHRSNSNCTMFVYFLKRNLYREPDIKYGMVSEWVIHSEYLALCEGDDYWTDPEKLQIQADCLDAHPEVDMCAHSYREVSAQSGRIIKMIRRRKDDCIIPAEDIIVGGGIFLATNSICYRMGIENYLPKFKAHLLCDYSQCIYGALKGGIFYIDKCMSVYRRFVPESWSDSFVTNVPYQKQFYERIIAMLTILNEEYEHKYDNSIKAAILDNSVLAINSRKENCKALWRYRKYYNKLTRYQKIKILAKCLWPEAGRKILICQNRYFSR